MWVTTRVEFSHVSINQPNLANYARIASREYRYPPQNDQLCTPGNGRHQKQSDWGSSNSSKKHEERVIVETFDTYLSYQDIITIAQELGRTVPHQWSQHESTGAISREMGYLKVEGVIKPLDKKHRKYPRKQTNHHHHWCSGWKFGGLNNISRGDHPIISYQAEWYYHPHLLLSWKRTRNFWDDESSQSIWIKIITIKDSEVHSGWSRWYRVSSASSNGTPREKIHRPCTWETSLNDSHSSVKRWRWDGTKNVLIIEDGLLIEIDENSNFSLQENPTQRALVVDGMIISSLETRAIKDRIQLSEEGVLVVNIKDATVGRGLFFPDEIAFTSHGAITGLCQKRLPQKTWR